MPANCDHKKVLVETDDGNAHKKVCPVCDDVQLATFDEGEE